MSEQSSSVTREHFAYLAARTTQEDDFLRELKDAARSEGIPSIWIAPEQAALMQILLRLAMAREVVEVGTLAGYSAICMARALPPGGRVHTIEIVPAHADFAEKWIARSDVSERITVHRGKGNEVLARFAENSFDAAFLDADKKSYIDYLSQCLRLVRNGGLIMADNAFAFGQLFDDQPTDPEAPAIRAFNDHMATIETLQRIIVPIGDGLWIGVKLNRAFA